MRGTISRSMLLATTFALAGCGGGGGGSHVSSTPTPTPTPLAPAIIPAAMSSQQFAAMGASHPSVGNQPPLLDAANQLQVRYVAASNSYEVQVPNDPAWAGISFLSSDSGPIDYGGGTALLWLRKGTYQYSRIFEWAGGGMVGHEAIGMATPAGGVPVTGSASYLGTLLGFTSENHSGDDAAVDGTITLSFNFGVGSLSGSITPNVHQNFPGDALGTINFRDTIYSTGSTSFSGHFDTTVPGVNSFSGLFTGPNAQELIGNFALPYISPIDGLAYQADGAFIAK